MRCTVNHFVIRVSRLFFVLLNNVFLNGLWLLELFQRL